MDKESWFYNEIEDESKESRGLNKDSPSKGKFPNIWGKYRDTAQYLGKILGGSD